MPRLLLALVLSFIPCTPAQAEELRGRVVGITDGDTLTLLVQEHQETIRLAEIDAPEKRQPFGQRAKQALSALAFGKPPRILSAGRDRYGRIVARVYTQGEDGETDISSEMVRQGAAWVFDRYASDGALYALQDEARAARRGLWALPAADQVPPWEWRRPVKPLAP